MGPTGCKVLDRVEEVILCLFVAVDDCLPGILWEKLIFDYELVEVVPQKIGACVASMAVEHAKEAALGPVFDVLLAGRLHYIKDNADSILVVVSYDALVCVGGITHYATVFSHAAFSWLPGR